MAEQNLSIDHAIVKSINRIRRLAGRVARPQLQPILPSPDRPAGLDCLKMTVYHNLGGTHIPKNRRGSAPMRAIS